MAPHCTAAGGFGLSGDRRSPWTTWIIAACVGVPSALPAWIGDDDRRPDLGRRRRRGEPAYLVGGWVADRLGSAFPYGTLVVNVDRADLLHAAGDALRGLAALGSSEDADSEA